MFVVSSVSPHLWTGCCICRRVDEQLNNWSVADEKGNSAFWFCAVCEVGLLTEGINVKCLGPK